MHLSLIVAVALAVASLSTAGPIITARPHQDAHLIARTQLPVIKLLGAPIEVSHSMENLASSGASGSARLTFENVGHQGEASRYQVTAPVPMEPSSLFHTGHITGQKRPADAMSAGQSSAQQPATGGIGSSSASAFKPYQRKLTPSVPARRTRALGELKGRARWRAAPQAPRVEDVDASSTSVPHASAQPDIAGPSTSPTDRSDPFATEPDWQYVATMARTAGAPKDWRLLKQSLERLLLQRKIKPPSLLRAEIAFIKEHQKAIRLAEELPLHARPKRIRLEKPMDVSAADWRRARVNVHDRRTRLLDLSELT